MYSLRGWGKCTSHHALQKKLPQLCYTLDLYMVPVQGIHWKGPMSKMLVQYSENFIFHLHFSSLLKIVVTLNIVIDGTFFV